MKLMIDVENIELLDSALSHAIRAYSDVVGAEQLGCKIPYAFEQYFEKNKIYQYDERYKHLKNRLDILEELEKQVKEKANETDSYNSKR